MDKLRTALQWSSVALIATTAILLVWLTLVWVQPAASVDKTLFVSKHICYPNRLVDLEFAVRSNNPALVGTLVLMDLVAPNGQVLNGPTTEGAYNPATGLTTWRRYGYWNCEPFCPKSWRITAVYVMSDPTWHAVSFPSIPAACHEIDMPSVYKEFNPQGIQAYP